MDHYVGELLARLEREGLARDTIVVFMGDNGQCLFRSKQFLYDGGISVPLIIAWPDGRRAGEVDRQLVSSIDVTAALLGFAGAPRPPAMQGRDFLAPGASPRTHVFAARDRMDTSTDRMRAVRTDRWKYIRNYFPPIPYMQHNTYKEKEYPTRNLVKQLAKEGKLTPEAALFAVERKTLEELFELAAGGGVGPLDYYGCDGRPWTREEDQRFPHGGANSESGKGNILLSGIGQLFIDTARRVPGRRSFLLAENHDITSAMIDALDLNYTAPLDLRPDVFAYYYYPRNVQKPDRAMETVARHVRRFRQG